MNCCLVVGAYLNAAAYKCCCLPIFVGLTCSFGDACCTVSTPSANRRIETARLRRINACELHLPCGGLAARNIGCWCWCLTVALVFCLFADRKFETTRLRLKVFANSVCGHSLMLLLCFVWGTGQSIGSSVFDAIVCSWL